MGLCRRKRTGRLSGRVLEVEIDKDRKEERVWVGASVAVHLYIHVVSCNKLYLQSTISVILKILYF